MTTILVVEDDRSLNKGIALTLAQDGVTIRQVYDVAGAQTLLRAEKVDLLLLDIHLPDGSGLDLCEQIRRESRIPIIFLTANDLEIDIVTGLELGADDYITKPFSLMVLRARVMAVLRRLEPLEREKLIYGDLELDFERLEFYRRGQALALSRTECKLLRTLVRHPGQILTREQLMDQVWSGEAEFVDENALTVTIKRLRAKLEDEPSAPEYIKTVYGLGYVWAVEGGGLR